MIEQDAKILNSKFQSPIPFIIQLRNLIFGTVKPGIYTRITFYVNLIGLFIFSFWSVMSYCTIIFRSMFLEHKNVDVAAIIAKRGEELGYSGDHFMNRLATFHGLSLFFWLSVFIGLIFMWRRKKIFAYFYFGGLICYFAMQLFYIGFTYYWYDNSSFDKIAFLIMVVNTVFYYFLTRGDRSDAEITFFD